MTVEVQHLIAGERQGGGEAFARPNPARPDEIVSLAPTGGAAEVDQAVQAAQAAFGGWSTTSPEVRSDVLDKAGDLILSRRTELGTLLAREEGKTLTESIGEVTRAGRILKFFAGEALRVRGATVVSVRPGVEVATYRDPIGVVGLITPWNFPIAIPAWKLAPALAFGCTAVIKPSELTPLLTEALVSALVEAGASPGVVNVVYGAGAAGAALAAHPGVQAVSFTGSQTTGARIAAAVVPRQARLQMEMGGKNPLLVLDDADLDVAVRCSLDGAFFGSGQRCTASSRLIVARGVHDAFVERLAKETRALCVGDPLDPATRIGPLVSEPQRDKVARGVTAAAAEGAEIAASAEACPEGGCFYAPTLLVGTTTAMQVNQVELFGPVASVIKVEDLDEGIAVANAGEFGLSAGVVTRSWAAANRFRREVRAGMVMVNLPTAGVDYHVPFGGVGSSSYGPREQGFAAVEFYTQVKTAYLGA